MYNRTLQEKNREKEKEMKKTSKTLDLEQTYKFLDCIFSRHGKREIRIIGRQDSKDGIFTPNYTCPVYALGTYTNASDATNAIASHFEDGIAHNCYIVANPLKDVFEYKEENYIKRTFEKMSSKVAIKGLASDDDIKEINSIVVDLDRKLPKGNELRKLCASEEELSNLNECRIKIFELLERYELFPSYQICSGNGFQMGYFFDSQANNTETRNALNNLLVGLNGLFPFYQTDSFFPTCDVDVTMSNPSRPSRIPGLLNHKKDRQEILSEGRIYRVSQLIGEVKFYQNKFENMLSCYDEGIKPRLPKQANINVPVSLTESKNTNIERVFGDAEKELSSFVERHDGQDLFVLQRTQKANYPLMYKLRQCPWHSDHSSGTHINEAFLAVNTQNEIIFYCSHSSCQNKKVDGKIVEYVRTYQKLKELLHDNITVCKYCKAEITMQETDENHKTRPYNIDGTRHECQQYKDKRPITTPSAIATAKPINWSQKQVEETEPLSSDEINKLQSDVTIKDVIDACYNGTILFLMAATGTRKTTTALRKAVEDKENKYTFLHPTIAEVNKVSEDVKAMLIEDGQEPEKTMAKIISGTQQAIEDDEQTRTDYDTNKRIIISTYAYLLRKGHTVKLYAIAKDLLKARIVICDEPQLFWQQLLFSFRLFQSYHFVKSAKTKKGCFYENKSCLKAARKGNCSGCFKTSEHAEPNTHSRTQEFKFADEISESGFTPVDENEIILGETAKDLLDTKGYSHITGNLFWRPLKKECTLSKEPFLAALKASEESENQETYQEILESILSTLYNPHLRIEAPIRRKTNEILTQDLLKELQKTAPEETESKRVQYSKHPCNCPLLCGVDVLPVAQLFYLAKKVIFLSATIPNEMIQTFYEIAQIFDKKFEAKTIDKILTMFDVTMLKITAKLSVDVVNEIIVGKNGKAGLFKSTDKNIFLVFSTRDDANRAYEHLTKFYPNDVEIFSGKDFHGQDFARRSKKESSKRILITYGHSAITRAFNLPDYTIAIIDCELYIPMIAVALAIARATQDSKLLRLSIFDSLKNDITQIIGRLLRTPFEITDKDTVFCDPRKLTFLLYGLPTEFVKETLIDEKLCYKLTQYESDFVASDESKNSVVAQNVQESVLLAIEGKPLVNQKEKAQKKKSEEIQSLATKAVLEDEKPLNQIPPREREIAKPLLQEKRQQKQIDRLLNQKQKLDQMLANNPSLSIRDIRQKFNLDRSNNSFLKKEILVHFAQRIFEKELAQNPNLEYLQSKIYQMGKDLFQNPRESRTNFEIQYAIKIKLDELKLKAKIDKELENNPNITEEEIKAILNLNKLDEILEKELMEYFCSNQVTKS